MSVEETLSIKIAPELLVKAEALASRQGRSVDQWIVSLVSDYVARGDKWTTLLERTRSMGKEMGIQDEADVDRRLGEFRTEKRT